MQRLLPDDARPDVIPKHLSFDLKSEEKHLQLHCLRDMTLGFLCWGAAISALQGRCSVGPVHQTPILRKTCRIHSPDTGGGAQGQGRQLPTA